MPMSQGEDGAGPQRGFRSRAVSNAISRAHQESVLLDVVASTSGGKKQDEGQPEEAG